MDDFMVEKESNKHTYMMTEPDCEDEVLLWDGILYELKQAAVSFLEKNVGNTRKGGELSE